MAITTANLVAEWHGSYATGTGPNSNGDAGTRGTWVDIKGAYDLTATNYAFSSGTGEWAGAGTEGDPYCFIGDADNGYFIGSAANNAMVDFDSAWTFEVWGYFMEKNSDHFIASLQDYDGNAGFSTRCNTTTGYFSFSFGNDGADSNAPNETALGDVSGAWKHIVATYASEKVSIYINNTAGTGLSVSGWGDPWTATMDTVTLCGNGWSGSSGHKVSVARLYSACLSSGEVSANYAAGILANASGLGGAPATFTGLTVTRLLQG